MSNSQCWIKGPGGQPKSDDEYFERMTHVVFQAGMPWEMIDARWSNFTEAFAKFSIEKVANFTQKEVDHLLNDTGIIRNKRKILATIENAKELKNVIKEFGSLSIYFNNVIKSKDHKVIRKELMKRFHYLGPMSSDIFLLSIGFNIKGASSAPWIAKTRK
ncbi:MAG: DNA-3-methyladenine glycosylase I [Candidatus Heimdallarchaeaceae archaeon]|jgi:DNA-3-methyladenine glycosylase I